jgi:hypothetical protein
MTDPVADHLRAAADCIDVNGWMQEGWHPDLRCVHLALADAGTGEAWIADTFDAARTALLRYLGLPTNQGAEPLWAWNDAPGRTHGEVTDTLRTVAKAIDEARDFAEQALEGRP